MLDCKSCLRDDCPNTLVSKDLQEECVLDAAINDMGAFDPLGQRLQRTLDLWDHSAMDHAGLDQTLCLRGVESRDESPTLSPNPIDIG